MQNVRIIRSRRTTLSIEIQPGGEIWVRAPQRLSTAAIQDALNEKADWIRRMQARVPPAAPPPRVFAPGERLPYRGRDYPLVVSPSGRIPLVFQDGVFGLAQSALPKARAVFEAWYRAEARCLFETRLTELSALTGLRPAGSRPLRLRLSSARTRWGSYSTSGTLSLNWRLVLAPPEILDYVILHELAHTRFNNHSAAFWSLVESLLPDYKPRRKWLKDHGARLFL